MEHDEWHGFGIWIIFRILFAIILVGIIFSIFFGGFGVFSNMPFFTGGWVWRLVGIIFLLWFVSWIFVWPWRHRYWGERWEIRILRRRYARGEISRVQFKRMMKDLERRE